MPKRPARPVARLSTPAELVASLPYSVGFTPTESLVVLCCHEPRGRLGLCIRIDLPAAAEELPVVAELVERVRLAGATRVVLAVYTAEPDLTAALGRRCPPDGPAAPDRPPALPRHRLVAALVDALDGLTVTEAVLVRGGRFWSYRCRQSSCCPPEGRPVAAGEDAASVRLLQVESVLSGRAVLPDRAAVVASLAAPVLLAAVAAARHCELSSGRLAAAVRRDGLAATRAVALSDWGQARVRFRSPPAALDDAEAAALAISLTDLVVRDAVAASWQLDDEALPMLLTELCRRTPSPYDAPVCTLLAWLSYAAGGGALVGVALDRALRTDPSYSLAVLLTEAIARQLPPRLLRRAMQAIGAPPRAPARAARRAAAG